MENPLPQRKKPRLQGHDYSQSGMYFVTICTHERTHYFGQVENQTMSLNSVGEVALSCWLDIPKHHSHIELDAHVIMPNHVHGILTINVADNDKKFATLSTVISTYKAAVTRFVRRQTQLMDKLWQSSFHDHIIRSETSLNTIRDYVNHNPALWKDDQFYSEG